MLGNIFKPKKFMVLCYWKYKGSGMFWNPVFYVESYSSLLYLQQITIMQHLLPIYTIY
jgi:hypothetical protein